MMILIGGGLKTSEWWWLRSFYSLEIFFETCEWELVLRKTIHNSFWTAFLINISVISEWNNAIFERLNSLTYTLHFFLQRVTQVIATITIKIPIPNTIEYLGKLKTSDFLDRKYKFKLPPPSTVIITFKISIPNWFLLFFFFPLH